ncbi:MAG: hypothetical protein CL908_20090 [Deltaproteobacteria bacterium]|nr:hypothetical protein [Deltaproteobacteria bacterium]
MTEPFPISAGFARWTNELQEVEGHGMTADEGPEGAAIFAASSRRKARTREPRRRIDSEIGVM